VAEALDELEEGIEALKVKYERYFNGVDRVPPVREREAIERAVREFLRAPPGTTSLRFRFTHLKQRLATYQHYWNRILTQIENGAHARIPAHARRSLRAGPSSAAAPEPPPADAPADAEPPTAAAAAPARPARPPPPPPSLPPGLSAGETRRLYQAYIAAKRAVGESVDGVTYGSLVAKLARELPRLRQRHEGEIQFEVATVDGKVRLRARPR
jgi:hypothetical protein